jgi:hypothetical protein
MELRDAQYSPQTWSSLPWPGHDPQRWPNALSGERGIVPSCNGPRRGRIELNRSSLPPSRPSLRRRYFFPDTLHAS